MHAVYVVERVLSGLAAEGRVARSWRLGSLRAGSQVIRAHLLRRVNDERGRARITCSLRPWLIPRVEQSARDGLVFDLPTYTGE